MAKVVNEQMLSEANGKKLGGNSDYWIYLTNLKAYNEGILVGVYLHFPFTRDELNEAFKMIYVDSDFVDEHGESYEEYFITDYDVPFDIDEYEYAPSLIDKFKEIEPYMDYSKEIIRVIADHSCSEFIMYELFEGSTNEEKLGYVLYYEGMVIIPEHLRSYVDYEAIGRDYAINADGEFVDNYYIEFH